MKQVHNDELAAVQCMDIYTSMTTTPGIAYKTSIPVFQFTLLLICVHVYAWIDPGISEFLTTPQKGGCLVNVLEMQR